MKRRAVLLVSLCALGAAAQERPAGVKTGYSEKTLGEVMQAALARQSNGAVYGVRDYPQFRVRLTPGAGRQLTEAWCSTCHSTRYITMQPPLPAATWKAVVDKMIVTYGQEIPPTDAEKIVRYLQRNYTPETRKKQ